MNTDSVALLIPIVGIIFGVGVAIVAIITSHREKALRSEQRHRERLAAIEKGIELPPEPVENGDNEPKKAAGLKSGVSSLLVGIVLYFALREVAGEDVAIFGLIPAAIGAANLAFYFLEGRKK